MQRYEEITAGFVGVTIGFTLLAVFERCVADFNIQSFFEENFGDCCEFGWCEA